MRKRSILAPTSILGAVVMIAGCQDQATAPAAPALGPALSVTYTPNSSFPCPATPNQTCIGFIGKGDVQNLPGWGWNNATAQAEATKVTFSENSVDEYDVEIKFDTGNPAQPQSVQHHTVTQGKSTSVLASVASDPRKTGQFTGWNLLSRGETVVTGDAIPNVGDSCPNGFSCVVTAVTLVSHTGGLYVSDTNLGLGPTLLSQP